MGCLQREGTFKNPSHTHECSPQKKKYQPEQTKYKMNQYSNTVVKKNLACPWKSLRKDLSNDLQTLKQIEGDNSGMGKLEI